MLKALFYFLRFYLTNKGDIFITGNLQKLYFWRNPIKPYTFIRTYNKIKSTNTKQHFILLQGGVIVFNSFANSSKEYILDFCKKHPQFIPTEYFSNLLSACDTKYKENNLNPRLNNTYNINLGVRK